MGEQQEIGVELYHAGSPITVRHDWGHTTEATLGDISPKQTFAWLRFGMAGERKVRLTPVPSNRPPPGRFYGEGMSLWRIDQLTTERIIKTGEKWAEGSGDED